MASENIRFKLDVECVTAHIRARAICGDTSPAPVYVRRDPDGFIHITAQTSATNYDLAQDGWKLTRFVLTPDIPYSQHWNWLKDKLATFVGETQCA